MALARPLVPDSDTSLLGWWLGELRAMLPRRWREPARVRHDLVVQIEPPFARLHLRRGRRLESVGSLVLEQPGSAGSRVPEPRLRRVLDRYGGSAVLVLSEADALTCVDVLPAAAEGELARIMAHKLDLLTPWSAEQGYSALRVLGRRRDGMLEVLVAAASRARVDGLLKELAQHGIRPVAVDVALPGEDRRAAGVDLLHAAAPERRNTGLIGIVLAALALTLTVAAGWAGWQIYHRRQLIEEQHRLERALEERLADLPELSSRIETLRAQARFLADDRSKRASPLLVLEVLSRLLPDTVWLTEATLDGNELSIGGLAEDASSLVPLVEAAAEFEQVRFLAPSTRIAVPGSDGTERQVERFALRAIVNPNVASEL